MASSRTRSSCRRPGRGSWESRAQSVFPAATSRPAVRSSRARPSTRGSSTRTASIARRVRRGFSCARRTLLPRSKGKAPNRCGRATCWCSSGAALRDRAWRRSFNSPPRSKYLSWGREVAVLTDARFSGVSTGACIGWVTPEALAGGPLGKVRDGDQIRIVIDRHRLEGSVDLIGDAQRLFSPEEAASVLQQRTFPARAYARPGLALRYAAVGRAAKGQRRALGRLRFRRRSDCREARLKWSASEIMSGSHGFSRTAGPGHQGRFAARPTDRRCWRPASQARWSHPTNLTTPSDR